MKIFTRLITGSDDTSYFIDEDLKFHEDKSWPLSISSAFKAGKLEFWQTKNHFIEEWVNAPRKQFFIYLSGKIEIQVGNGEKRKFSKGEVLLVEDCLGQGHMTKIIEPMLAVVVTIDS